MIDCCITSLHSSNRRQRSHDKESLDESTAISAMDRDEIRLLIDVGANVDALARRVVRIKAVFMFEICLFL